MSFGLTNWKNSPDGLIYKYDVSVAKNYLTEEELTKLTDLTNIFLVFAEDEAKESLPQEEILLNSPKTKKGSFCVPKMLD